MEVSANIIRFPSAASAIDRREETQREPGDIVTFTSPLQIPVFDADSQQHGQVFAAHRIVARVADQLDSFASL
jgi:hypothetical protein